MKYEIEKQVRRNGEESFRLFSITPVYYKDECKEYTSQDKLYLSSFNSLEEAKIEIERLRGLEIISKEVVETIEV